MNCSLESDLPAGVREAMAALLSNAPNGHYTQHPGWASVPEIGPPARPCYFLGEQNGRLRTAALVRLRSLRFGYKVAEVFRGPTAVSPGELVAGLAGLRELLVPHKTLVLRIDPYWSGPENGEVQAGLKQLGFAPMTEPPPQSRSLEIDIARDPDQLLASFKPATRRQVRKALRLGIVIEKDLDDGGVDELAAMYRTMSEAKGAIPRSVSFFKAVRDLFRSQPGCGFFLGSRLDGRLLGAIAVFTLGRRAIYAFGSSSALRPEIPKNHLLHFAAMQRARDEGCAVYDMGGFSVGVGQPGSQTATQKINYFKSGFGGRPVDFIGAHELVFRPVSYRILRTIRRSLWM